MQRADKTMTSHCNIYFRSLVFAVLLAAVSRGLVPEEVVFDDVIDTWSLSCSEAQLRCDVDITCRVLLDTIDKVCDQSGTSHQQTARTTQLCKV